MASQNEDGVSELLEKIPEWSSQEVKERLDDTLPILLSFKEEAGYTAESRTVSCSLTVCLQRDIMLLPMKVDCLPLQRLLPIYRFLHGPASSLEQPEQTTQAVKSIQSLLGICLPFVPINCVEKKLFQYVLPATRRLFNEVLEHIQSSLQQSEADDVVECLNGLLQVCIELLGCVDSALQYALSNGKLEAVSVPSLPKETAHILSDAFRHCKESEKIYGSLFRPLAEELTAFFQKSHEVQLHFLALITDNLAYNCIFEDELMLLVEVLEMVGRIGHLLMGLDVKTMAEQWKAYARLAVQYYEQVKQHLNLAETLTFLAKDLSSSLEVDWDSLDEKLLLRKLKIGSFTLKIIIKLCGQYKGYLGSCHRELLDLLTSLYSNSSVCLQRKNVSQEKATSIEQHLIIGAEPLLSQLTSETEFIESYCHFGNKIAEYEHERLSFLLLSMTILKKLMPLDQSTRNLWLQNEPSANVLYIIMRTLDHCHAELNDDLTLPGVTYGGEPARKTDLYEALLTNVAAFILTVPAKDFSMIEHLLLESLLHTSPWRAVLAMDVWCLVARSGSAELCFQHTCFIAEICKSVGSCCGRPEKVFIKKLLARLFQLLTNSHKIKMVEMFPPHINHSVWEAIGIHMIPEELRERVTNIIISATLSATNNFLSQSAPGTRDYKQMVNLLAAAVGCVDQIQSCNQLISNLVTLWRCVDVPEVYSKEEISVQGSQWLHHFVVVLNLFTAAAVKHINNIQLIQILQSLKQLIGLCDSSIKLGAIELLHALASKVIEADVNQQRALQLIASLFSLLLQDGNPLVQQTAIQTFAYFAHVIVHEDILVLTVKGNPLLQQKVTRFIQKIPTELPEEVLLSYQDYLRCQSMAAFTHTCKKARTCEVKPEPVVPYQSTHFDVPNIDNPPKKIKLIVTPGEATQAIERLRKDAETIAAFCESNSLTEASREAIMHVIDNLQLCVKR